MSRRAILVTGATGKQGGATIDWLIANGALKDHVLLAVTRDRTSGAAKKLESRGVKIVQGDLNDCSAIFKDAQRVLGGDNHAQIWGVFSVQVRFLLVSHVNSSRIIAHTKTFAPKGSFSKIRRNPRESAY